MTAKKIDKEYGVSEYVSIPDKKFCHICSKTLESQTEKNPLPYVDPEYEPDVDGDNNKVAKLNGRAHSGK